MSLPSLEAEQHAAQADALQNGEALALAKRATKAGTFDRDISAGLVRYCPRSLEILGHQPDRSPVLTAAEWAQHIFPGDAERVLGQGRRAREDGADLIVEYRIVRPDGGIRWVRGLGRTLCDAAGEAVRCVGFNFDITDEKDAEAASRRMQAELIQASRLNAMAMMAETLAHELNQPLTTIASYASGARSLLDGPATDRWEDVREALEGAAAASLRAGDIVRTLRAYTRPDHGGGSTLLDVAIRKALEPALRGADELGIRSEASLEEGLVVPIEDLQVQQVVYNLVRNAIDATGPSARKEIEIYCRKDGDRAVVRVADSGVGVPAALRSRMFEPFVTSKMESAGVGLAICRTIIEGHGGTLSAEHLEDGTVIEMTLPLDHRYGRTA